LVALRYHWLQSFPGVPVPVRLPFGGWWLAENDYCGSPIVHGVYETAECAFVGRYLRTGMTVLDIGAHHGFYTLLASHRIGRAGRVLAFEPSLRERRKLVRHLRLNCCANVKVLDCALGSSEGSAELFLVQGTETGCNSLRPPNVSQPTTAVTVKLDTLDRRLASEGVGRVDFVKLDVEGAEIEVLKGSVGMLERRPRPVVLCEIQDIRTAPWGYRAKAIAGFLSARDFRWFSLSPGGLLRPLDPEADAFDGNYVAVPSERLAALARGPYSLEFEAPALQPSPAAPTQLC
jgi:FkbM family methyltransferase